MQTRRLLGAATFALTTFALALSALPARARADDRGFDVESPEVARVVTASPSDIDEARRTLDACARRLDRDGVKATNLDATNPSVARELEVLRKLPVGLNAWAAVMGDERRDRPRTPLENALGVELVASQGAKARGPLAFVVKMAGPETPLARELFAAIARVGDDEARTIEAQLAAKVRAYPKARAGCTGTAAYLVDALGAVGTHRAVAVLVAWFLAPETSDPAGAIPTACRRILERSKEPDPGVAALLAAIDVRRLPEPPRLGRLLDLCRFARTNELLKPIAAVLEELLHQLPVLSKEGGSLDANQALCLEGTLGGLASIGSKESIDRIFKTIDRLEGPDEAERRRCAIASLCGVKVGKGGPDLDLMEKLIERLAIADRGKADFQGYASVLEAYTEANLNGDVAGWRRWLAERRQPKNR